MRISPEEVYEAELKSGETVIEKLLKMIENIGIDSAFCPICGACLPPTLYVSSEKWDEFCEEHDLESGLVCPKCLAKEIDKEDFKPPLETYGWSGYRFTIEDLEAAHDFGELANIVMFLDPEIQFWIRNLLRSQKEKKEGKV